MGRLGVLYALTEAELQKLLDCPREERYEYMLEEIEETLLGTPRGCEVDKAWEGLQFCFCGGKWDETNEVPANIVFAGEFLVETEDDIMTLKRPEAVKNITAYLREHDLEAVIRENFPKIDEEAFWFPKTEDVLEHILGWSEGLLPFYENAVKEGCSVIFTVDL